MRVVVVVGCRPQFIKAYPIIREAQKRNVETVLIHTGQHYDYEMSELFFDEFGLENCINLSVGSRTDCWQIGSMILKLEDAIKQADSNIVLVLGDTNSALAGALATVKLGVPLGHVEAGARSYDMTMPEEVNRRLVDHCSSLLFAPTENCVRNLFKENLRFVQSTGDVMYDVLLQSMPRIRAKSVLGPRPYILFTVHRPFNLHRERLRSIITALGRLSFNVVFPVHPRTRKQLTNTGFIDDLPLNVLPSAPVSYVSMMKLLLDADAVITDSGGLQKEAFWLKVPCFTLRETTEWPETVELGANQLITDPDELPKKIDNLEPLGTTLNPFGDGNAAHRIMEALHG